MSKVRLTEGPFRIAPEGLNNALATMVQAYENRTHDSVSAGIWLGAQQMIAELCNVDPDKVAAFAKAELTCRKLVTAMEIAAGLPR